MKENVLIEKSIEFGARIVRLQRYLVETKHETVLAKQILRSGTSIGANINEAQYGNSRADFIAKLHIALKETAETEYWLHLLEKSDYLEKSISAEGLPGDQAYSDHLYQYSKTEILPVMTGRIFLSGLIRE